MSAALIKEVCMNLPLPAGAPTHRAGRALRIRLQVRQAVAWLDHWLPHWRQP